MVIECTLLIVIGAFITSMCPAHTVLRTGAIGTLIPAKQPDLHYWHCRRSTACRASGTTAPGSMFSASFVESSWPDTRDSRDTRSDEDEADIGAEQRRGRMAEGHPSEQDLCHLRGLPVWDNIDNAHCRAMRRLRPLSLLHRVFLAAIL
jgi:hypothetical protein